MSETRNWKFDSENYGGHPGFRSQDEEAEFVCLTCDTPAAEVIILSLESSLAEVKAESARLREALSDLYDEQNGPPLIRSAADWQAAMGKAAIALAHVRGEEMK